MNNQNAFAPMYHIFIRRKSPKNQCQLLHIPRWYSASRMLLIITLQPGQKYYEMAIATMAELDSF
jgi:hypothetical protein